MPGSLIGTERDLLSHGIRAKSVTLFFWLPPLQVTNCFHASLSLLQTLPTVLAAFIAPPHVGSYFSDHSASDFWWFDVWSLPIAGFFLSSGGVFLSSTVAITYSCMYFRCFSGAVRFLLLDWHLRPSPGLCPLFLLSVPTQIPGYSLPVAFSCPPPSSTVPPFVGSSATRFALPLPNPMLHPWLQFGGNLPPLHPSLFSLNIKNSLLFLVLWRTFFLGELNSSLSFSPSNLEGFLRHY